MITVNLLPEAYRKPKVTSIQQFHRSPLAIIGVSVLVGLGLVLGGLKGLGQMHLGRLNARIQALASQHQAINEVTAAIATLREQQQMLEQLDRQRSQWAHRLNILSDVTPEGVWFTELVLDGQHTLTLHGAAISQGGEGMAAVSRFVQDLKAHQQLSGVFRDIQIQSIQNVQEGEIELMEFTLACELAGTPPAVTP